ncbi:MAG: peptidylprolyl isomerase [Flavobacteriaceae bacterium]|nr:peptidylprolyl isomerase [Flavobacteriaceae bacterium]
MKTLLKINSLILLILFFWSCNTKKESLNSTANDRKSVELVTDYGTMVIELYNETPLHRDNFIKLANEGAYDSLLFHRVIKEFMIQGGDPESHKAKPEDNLGNGGLSYKVDAELNPTLFHKKGAVGAARDGNPERASSGIQFYIVQRGIQNDSMLDYAETRINGWLADHYSYKDLTNKALTDSLQKAIDDKDMVRYTLFNDSLKKLAKTYTKFERYKIPEAHRRVYKSLGGTPHLDQNYTVFGQVIKGLEVVDSIATVQTGTKDRPITDVRIRSVRVLEKD